MSHRPRCSTPRFTARVRTSVMRLAPATVLIASCVVACGNSSTKEPKGDGGAGTSTDGGSNSTETSTNGGSGGSSYASTNATGGLIIVGSGIGGAGYNQCGVAAPLPKETGQCTTVSGPAITNFDDFAGSDAANYAFKVNAGTVNAVSGAILHVGDGSDEDGGTSVISTDMTTGEDGTGYALKFANTNAANWGGLLMLYFPASATALPCLDAQTYSGVQFSIKGSSPSGRFGVSLTMLDTSPTADQGLCDNAIATDCKDPRLELSLPKDVETWAKVQIPWSALTPGVGSGLSCVPVTGQNIVRLVIQPFMSYPPPDYAYEAGPYSITVDNISFY